jgi:hypothetical protein
MSMTVLILRRFYFFVNRRKPTKSASVYILIYTTLYYSILGYQFGNQVTVKLDTIGIPSDYQKTKTLYRRKIDFLCMSV